MPSPFPGMNPYLEHPDDWRDVHTTYLVYLRAQLAHQLSRDYTVRVEQSLHVSSKSLKRGDRFGVADIGVMDENTLSRSGGTAVAVPDTVVAAVAAPVRGTVPLSRATRRNRWLSVVDRRTRRIVTVIELLSPSNKVGTGRDQYLVKRLQLLASDCSLVEIDLLRGGGRMPLVGVPASDYVMLVSRPADRPAVDAWPVGLRQTLPSIPVPVLVGEPEPTVDLQAVLHQTYDAGLFERGIYDTPPVPPLAPADAEWAAGLRPTETDSPGRSE